MLTVFYPHTNGQVELSQRGYRMFSEQIPTLLGKMKAAGYYTGGVWISGISKSKI